MKKAFKDLERKNLSERLSRQKQQVGYLLLEYRDIHGEARKVFIWPDDILFIRPQENNANYIEYHLIDGSEHVVKKTLKKALEELQTGQFIQVHRGFVVNTSHIAEFQKQETLILKGIQSIEISVSRRYRKNVTSFFKSTGR